MDVIVVGFGLIILQFIMPGDEEVIKMSLVSIISASLLVSISGSLMLLVSISGPATEHFVIKITYVSRYDVTTENECCCYLGSMSFLLCYEMNFSVIILMIELSLALSARLLAYSFHFPHQLYKYIQ